MDLLQVVPRNAGNDERGVHDDDAPLLATKVLSALCSPARNYIRASLSSLIISQIAHMSKSCGESTPHIHLWVRARPPGGYVMRTNLIIGRVSNTVIFLTSEVRIYLGATPRGLRHPRECPLGGSSPLGRKIPYAPRLPQVLLHCKR